MMRMWSVAAPLRIPIAAGAQSDVYPKQGQSAQQTQIDQSECRAWASQQAAANPPASTSPRPLRGAAAGAAVGGLGSAMRRRDERREQAPEAPERAFAACMEGRGYSVR